MRITAVLQRISDLSEENERYYFHDSNTFAQNCRLGANSWILDKLWEVVEFVGERHPS